MAARLPLRRYTTQDGLAHNRVNQIVRDSHGFLWFCTGNGLSQFDGSTFVTFDGGRELCRSLLEDPRGFYWVVSGGLGIYRLDPGTDDPERVLTPYTGAGDVDAAGVDRMVRDRAGTLWAGGARGLFVLEERGGTGVLRAIDLPHAPGKASPRRVWALLEDRRDGLWIATAGGLLRRARDGRIARQPVLPGDRGTLVRALMEDAEGRIWAGHEAGLTVFVPGAAGQGTRFLSGSRVRHVLPSAPGEARLFTAADGLGRGLVSSLLLAADGRIWTTTYEGGLSVLDGTTFHTYTTAEGVGPRTSALVQDHEGNLWVGSQVEGASRLARGGFTSYGPEDGLSVVPRPAIVDAATGDVALLSGRRLLAFDGRRFSSVRLDLPIRDMPPVIRDHRGEWWIAAPQEVYRFPAVRTQDLASARPRAIYGRSGAQIDAIDALCEDGDGNIWISAGRGAPLARWERARGRIRELPVAVSGTLQSCASDRAGGEWLAVSGRLVRFRGDGLTTFTEADGVPDGGVTRLIVDRSGRLWAAGWLRGGLLRSDDPTAEHPRFQRYGTQQGLTGARIWAIAEDPFGRIYLGSPAGVDRLEPDTGRVRHFTTAEGLGNDEVHDIFLDGQGVLWFASLQSVSSLRPGPNPIDLPLPAVRIVSLRAGGIERPLPVLGRSSIQGIALPRARSQLEIAFAGIAFGLEGKLRFQYRLQGTGQDWSAPTAARSVNYGSLSPGRYRFQVRAVSAAEAVSPQPAVVAFTILPPIWMRWWFLAAAGLAVTAAAYAAHRGRMARVLAVERVRRRLAMDLHDDVGASLSQIAVLSEVARHQARGAGPELMGPLSRIGDVSRGMVDALSDIVWATHPGRDQLVDLLARMRRFATDLLTAREIELCFPGPESDLSLRLEPEVRRQVFLVFKEAIHNAARHSRCKRVEVVLEVSRGTIALRVSDDGIGFSQEGGVSGHGLSSMARRAAALDGSLQTVSGAGEGTTLIFRVPTRRSRSTRRNPPV